MEKSRAIELLKLAVPIKALTQQEYADFVEAVNMGMDALEQPTSPDTIDRKAAIDALQKCRKHCIDPFDSYHIDIQDAENQLSKVPTIQSVATDINVLDTISRQQAIDICNGAIDLWHGQLGEGALVAVRDRISELPPAQPEPQWIPVSERLPEDTQYVLLTVRRLNNAYNSTPFIFVGYIGWNQQHWWCAHDGDCEISKVEVLAWMPLPEAYKPNNK